MPRICIQNQRTLASEFQSSSHTMSLSTCLRLSPPAIWCVRTSRLQNNYVLQKGKLPFRRHASTQSEVSSSSSATQKPPRPLTDKEREFLERALRVNQAGELGANLIYSGQYSVLRHDKRLKPLIRHMWDQEIHHLDTFNHLLAKHRVRPTALRPLWNVAGYAVGVGTALMGEKAAMACTEAVEVEIGTHYNDQVRVLLDMLKDPELKEVMEGEGGELKGLLKTIRQFRDDELEHLDTAVEHDSKGAEGYEVLTAVIRGGCKAAIWLSSRF